MSSDPAGGGTLADVAMTRDNSHGVIGRRISLSVMLVIVLVGASGWLGVHAETAQVSSDGYQMNLTYPRVARAGLDIPWELRVTHPGGFSGPITVAVSANYYDIFEFQGFHPGPSSESSDGTYDYMTFPRPRGDVFTLTLDTYVQPASQIGRSATVKAIVHHTTVAEIHYSTLLIP